MKTNVVMKRELDGMKVEQNSKGGMFNATILATQWNTRNSKARKDVSTFLDNKKTKMFIEALSEEEKVVPSFLVSTTRGKNAKTLMHPYLFIKFAMWLNPKFEVKVIKFVYDELIVNRNLAGDNYKILSSSGSRLKGYDFILIAKSLQWIVFNKTGKGLRNIATEVQLKEINDIQSKLAFAIDMGYIKTFNQLQEQLRVLYRNKYNKISA